MHYLLYAVLFSAFAWMVLTVNGRRRLLALSLAGVMLVTLAVIPPQAEAQGPGGIVQAIQAVLKVLNSLDSACREQHPRYSQCEQRLLPNHGVAGAVDQPIHFAGAPNDRPISQSDVGHSKHQSAERHTAGAAVDGNPDTRSPGEQFCRPDPIFQRHLSNDSCPTDANQVDRDMSDFDDALTLDSLKTLKAADSATDLELQAADSIESAAGQAVPGSTPFLTATATSSSIRSQALTQKMLAAELRQEAARIAHQNGLRKRGAMFTTQLRGFIMNLSQHN